MRYLWIEDFDGRKSGWESIKEKLEEYFQLTNKNINICTLEETLEFLDIASNWNLFDAILIDIRFMVCREEQNEKKLYNEYFSEFLTEAKFKEYTYKINRDANAASSGVLLYLALVYKYNYNQNRIAFISANVDNKSDELVAINKMRRIITKAKDEQLDEKDKDKFSEENQDMYDLYKSFYKENIEFPIPETDEIDWNNLKMLETLETQIDEVERDIWKFLKKKEGENNDLKYNSVKSEFEKIGLKVPIAFEKPSDYKDKDIFFDFTAWVKKILKVEYYKLRSDVLPICIDIVKWCDDSNYNSQMHFNKLLGNRANRTANDKINKTSEVKYMLSKIIELFPPNVWIDNIQSFYVRVIKECVSLFDQVNPKDEELLTVVNVAEASVLKMVRNWISHQGIKEVKDCDVAFIFYSLVVAFFSCDNHEKIDYIERAEKFILKFDDKDKIEVENFERQLEQMIIIARKMQQESYERYEKKVGKNIADRNKQYCRCEDKTPIYNVISGIGNEWSDLREKVRMEHIYLLYLGILKERREEVKQENQQESDLEKRLLHRLIQSKVFDEESEKL